MEDYHVFSSENLTDWKDHGVILTQKDVEWVDPAAYSMWAPEELGGAKVMRVFLATMANL